MDVKWIEYACICLLSALLYLGVR